MNLEWENLQPDDPMIPIVKFLESTELEERFQFVSIFTHLSARSIHESDVLFGLLRT